jgi:PAS domain S-box-containing protein
MNEMDEVIGLRRHEMDDAIRDEHTHPFDPVAEAALSSIAIGFTGRLSKLVAELDAEERARLDMRTVTMHAASESVERTILFGFGTSIVMLLGAFLLLRREMERRKHSERWLSATLRSITDAVVAVDVDGNVNFTNPAVETQLGIQAATVRGSPLSKGLEGELGTFRSDGITRVTDEERPIVRALAGETIEQAELFIRSPGKPEGRWHSVNASPVRADDGTLQGAVAVSRDITELRSVMKADLHRSQWHEGDQRHARP